MKRIGYIDGRRVAGFAFSGASALDGMKLNISDIGTPSSGINRGVYINYTQNGIKTGSAEVNCFAIDLALQKAVINAYPIALYISSSGNPAINLVSPISMYVDDLGTGIGNFSCLDLGVAITNAPSGRFCFARLVRQGAGALLTDAFRLEAGPCTNLFNFAVNTDPIAAGAVGGSQDKKIKCVVAGTTYYIPMNTA